MFGEEADYHFGEHDFKPDNADLGRGFVQAGGTSRDDSCHKSVMCSPGSGPRATDGGNKDGATHH